MSANDQHIQSDCRLSGNERQRETLAPTPPAKPCRCPRHRHNMAGDSFETIFGHIPSQVRFSIPWQS
jgi:hypothetical protein